MSEDMTPEIYERLRLVEHGNLLNGEKLSRLEIELERMEAKKIDPMLEKVNDLHTTMTRNKGFWAGIFLMTGAIWTAIAGAVAASWRAITGGS